MTLYLQDSQVGDGRYAYEIYEDAPDTDATESLTTCPAATQTRDVAQYGIDYIRIFCEGAYTLQFTGSTAVQVVPIDPYSGAYAMWSNRGDESDMKLTQMFDFTGHTGPLTLEYQIWTDIEVDYDYAYLVASTDGGATWEIIQTPRSVIEDPSGNSYGWAYNGDTNGWLKESLDISAYAGQQVWLRFEYITDAAVNGDGLLLDDIAIPEIGYATDFETDNGGWEAEGFVRIENVLPQTYRVSLITYTSSEIFVDYIELTPENTAEIELLIGEDVNEVVLVVSGTTRFTRQRAAYQFEIR